MSNRDPRGYYKALGLSSGTTQHEIRLAYTFLKDAYKQGRKSMKIGEIQAAYDILHDPVSRKEYDSRNLSASKPEARNGLRLGSRGLLAVLLLVLAGVAAWALAPEIKARTVSFEVGDDLMWSRTSKPLGVVLEFADEHSFPEGGVDSAYKIQPASGEAVWLAARDLRKNCKVR